MTDQKPLCHSTLMQVTKNIFNFLFLQELHLVRLRASTKRNFKKSHREGQQYMNLSDEDDEDEDEQEDETFFQIYQFYYYYYYYFQHQFILIQISAYFKNMMILLNLEEFENSIAKMISQHNIKKLLNHDARRDHITRAIYDFQQDINQFKTVNHLNNKIQKSEHLLEIESQLKALIAKEIEDFKSINQQELQYTTNKIIQLESEIIPQLEQQQKQYNSNDDLTQIKKSQTDIVSTVKDLLKLKDMRIKDQNEVKTLEKQFKDFVFEFEKLRDQIGGVQGNVRTEMRKLQTDIDKDQNKKIDEMITRILLIEKELNIKIQGGFEKNQQIEVNINTMIESLKDSIDQQQDEIIKKHGLMIEQNEQNDALVREQLKLLQIDVESLQDHQIAINKKNDTLSIIVDKAYARLDLLEGQLKHYIQSEVERRQMSWEIESGEEAEIQQQHLINTLVLLSNQMVVSSSSQALQNKHYLEVFDSDNDYEMLKTILTYHEGYINCMIEHNKVLLTGSYDHSIPKLQNNFKFQTINNNLI